PRPTTRGARSLPGKPAGRPASAPRPASTTATGTTGRGGEFSPVSRRALLVALATALALGGGTLTARAVSVGPPSPVCVPRAQPPTAGLSLVSSQAVAGHPRVSDLTFASSALGAQVHADVLVPTSYDPSGTVRYPALYLLHGVGWPSYPAGHPDVVVGSGACSGAVDADLDYPVGGTGQVVVSNLPDQKPLDVCIWGDPVTQDVVWRDHDPTELARNFGGVAIY